MSKIPIDIEHYLWHKSPVPVWLERFALVVLAASFVAFVLTNVSKFNPIQRVCLGVGIVFLSIFVADLVYEKRIPAPSVPPDFATVGILMSGTTAKESGQLFYGVSESDRVLIPIDCMFWWQITSKDHPTTLSRMSVEIETTSGWIALRKIPLESINLAVAKPPNHVVRVELNEPDIISFFNKTIDSWKTVSGFGIYEYTNRGDAFPTVDSTIRVTLTDAQGQTIVREVKGPPTTADTFGGPTWGFKLLSDPIDVSGFLQRRW